MIFASVFVTAYVRYFLILRCLILFLPLFKIILIGVIIIWILIVRMLFCYLKYDLVFLFQIQVVWIDKHELVVICYIIILINLLIFFDNIQYHFVFLNQKLFVVMLVKWRKIFMFVLWFFVNQCLDLLHLNFVVASKCCEVWVI